MSEDTSLSIGRSNVSLDSSSQSDASADLRCYPYDHNALFDAKVLSRQHAVVTYRSSKFYLRDLNSSNGTFIVVEGKASPTSSLNLAFQFSVPEAGNLKAMFEFPASATLNWNAKFDEDVGEA